MTGILTIAAGVAVGILIVTVGLPLLLYIFVETVERIGTWYYRNHTTVREIDPETGQVNVYHGPEDAFPESDQGDGQ